MKSTLSFALFATGAQAWMPYARDLFNETGTKRWVNEEKVRGVSLGSQFVVEDWMAYDEWNGMGCTPSKDEWACVAQLGQDKANQAFEKHWDSWITENDIQQIKSYGLNTVRIPIGFWIYEDLVNDDEHYPQGGLKYLDRIVQWSQDAGLYVIMDLHGAPGSQWGGHQSTGRTVDNAEFFNQKNYDRACNFLEWMTNRIHTEDSYANVGMLEVLNEPDPNGDLGGMSSTYYPEAYKRIRSVEDKLNIADEKRLHIQFMGKDWGQNDPDVALPSTDKVAHDLHYYYAYGQVSPNTKESFMSDACNHQPEDGIIVGEWSLAVPEGSNDLGIDQIDWYKKWWAAQVQAYERAGGWVFWSWKCNYINGGNEWRWCYKSAVEAGAIPKDAGSASSMNVC